MMHLNKRPRRRTHLTVDSHVGASAAALRLRRMRKPRGQSRDAVHGARSWRERSSALGADALVRLELAIGLAQRVFESFQGTVDRELQRFSTMRDCARLQIRQSRFYHATLIVRRS